MADEAIAVIVAGSGKVTEPEVLDLLEDYLQNWYDVQLIVPVSKSLFSEAVQHALAWYDDDKAVIPVVVAGENFSRAGARVGNGDDDTEHVKTFEEIFEDEFDGFDQVEFFIAMPEPEDEDAYDQAAGWVEAALDSKADVKVKNLCAGLDDVILAEPEEPEPDPEPEKPARRDRRKAADPDPEPVVEEKPARRSRAKKVEPDSEPEVQHEVNKVAAKTRPNPSPPPGVPGSLQESFKVLDKMNDYLRSVDRSVAILNDADPDVPRSLTQKYWDAVQTISGYFTGDADPETPIREPEKAAEAAPKGRGRPRTNFEVKEIYDEDRAAWMPRPRGRVAKGTKFRVRHEETNEILDEGTV